MYDIHYIFISVETDTGTEKLSNRKKVVLDHCYIRE